MSPTLVHIAKLALVALTFAAPLIQDQEAWTRAAALEATDRAACAELVVTALREHVGPPEGWQQGLAFRVGTALAENGELEQAAMLQVLLHEDVGADWSAINAAISLGRLGRNAEAEALLVAHEPLALDQAEIANQRGLLAQGRSDSAAARRHFGRALVAGSRNAGLSLARMDLEAGAFDRARIGFRPGVDDAQPADWALRGWALTLLP